MIAVDSNILVYAHRKDSPFHPKAIARVTALASSTSPWAIAWASLHEFLAIVTHPKIYDPPTPLVTALEAVRAWQASSSLRLLGEGPGYFGILCNPVSAGFIVGPKIHDARIASICLYHGVKQLWSADRDFTSFPDISCKNPLISRPT